VQGERLAGLDPLVVPQAEPTLHHVFLSESAREALGADTATDLGAVPAELRIHGRGRYLLTAIPTTAENVVMPQGARSRPCIIIADDDADVRKALAREARAVAGELVLVADVAAALVALERARTRVAVVMSDYDMGHARETGLALLAEVQRRDPRTLRVLVTGSTNAAIDAAVTSGLVEHLFEKPWLTREIGSAVARGLAELLGDNTASAIRERHAALGFRSADDGAVLAAAVTREAGAPSVLGLFRFPAMHSPEALRPAVGVLRRLAERSRCTVLRAAVVTGRGDALARTLWRAARPHVVPVSALPLAQLGTSAIVGRERLGIETDAYLTRLEPVIVGASPGPWHEVALAAWTALELGESELAKGLTPAKIVGTY
jgi:ActR/RegA family two-component response regulator